MGRLITRCEVCGREMAVGERYRIQVSQDMESPYRPGKLWLLSNTAHAVLCRECFDAVSAALAERGK